MGTNEKVKGVAVEIISDNFGQTTALMYEEYYADKDVIFILNHLNNLLIEFLGPQKAKEKIEKLKQIVNIKEGYERKY